MVDRGDGHQDRSLAGRGGAGQTLGEPGLCRRPRRPRRALLCRGQPVCERRAARHDEGRNEGVGRGGGGLGPRGVMPPKPATRDETMSDWSQVTRPVPVPNEWTRPFWEAARRGSLELQRCQSCHSFQHPPYATCVKCVSVDLKFEAVRGVGSIYAYTIMYHTGDKRFAPAVPYASIIVEL